jgi:hypothetical protein
MQPQHTVDEALTPESTVVTSPSVAQRSARRATARRASNRRATARQRKDAVEEHIVEYLNNHPQSTTGELAKGLNADRGTIAARMSHMVWARGTSQARAVR